MRPTTASRMTMMRKTVMSEMKPPTLPISSRAIWPRVLPLRRMEAEENGEILHGSSKDGAEEDPERSRQIAELGGEGGSDERARAGDSREVMAEENPFVGGFEIVAVAQTFGGGGAEIIERHDFRGDEFRVKAEADGVDARGGGHEPETVYGFAMIAGDDAQANRGRRLPRQPKELRIDDAYEIIKGRDRARPKTKLPIEPATREAIAMATTALFTDDFLRSSRRMATTAAGPWSRRS